MHITDTDHGISAAREDAAEAAGAGATGKTQQPRSNRDVIVRARAPVRPRSEAGLEGCSGGQQQHATIGDGRHLVHHQGRPKIPSSFPPCVLVVVVVVVVRRTAGEANGGGEETPLFVHFS
jgi:hypothetical protein